VKSRILIVTILVLFLGVVAAAYFLFDLSSRNNELIDNLQQLNQQLSDTTDHLDVSEHKVESLTDEVGQLSAEADNLTLSLADLQSDYEELYEFTYCGDDLIDLEMVYRSNAKGLEALTQWVDKMWGDVIDSYWNDFWTPDGPGLHVVETGYANDYFIVYFEQQNFYDAPSSVFIVSHHCWLDVELEN
jgi:regulator of replication initiation timing